MDILTFVGECSRLHKIVQYLNGSISPGQYIIQIRWQLLSSLFKHNISYASDTVYPKKYAHGFCFAVLCCGYTLTDFPISIRLTSLALWQSNDYPSASKATMMNMDKYFMWIHYERFHNHNKAKHNKTVWIFLGIYCIENISLHDICSTVSCAKNSDVTNTVAID